MRVVLAPDSFKECLEASAVCAALARGIRRAAPGAAVVAVPMADGGEGTLAALLGARPGERVTRTVHGPLGRPVQAAYGWWPATGTAVIEAAAANGLMLVPPAERNPLRTTTRGVGELLLAALARGARRIVVTIGGSATVDGGLGLARALGYQLLDAAGHEVPEGGAGLLTLARIVPPAARPWQGVTVEVACDVDNPLSGPSGAAPVFGPQKGATPAMVAELDAGLQRLEELLARDLGVAVAGLPGGGAAGGLGAGLVAWVGGRLTPGVELVLDLVGLRERLAGASFVITGEGRTDSQTLRGKVCAGVARAAQAAGVPCVVVSGAVTATLAELRPLGVTAAFSLCRQPCALAAALAQAEPWLEEAGANLAAWFAAGNLQTMTATEGDSACPPIRDPI